MPRRKHDSSPRAPTVEDTSPTTVRKSSRLQNRRQREQEALSPPPPPPTPPAKKAKVSSSSNATTATTTTTTVATSTQAIAPATTSNCASADINSSLHTALQQFPIEFQRCLLWVTSQQGLGESSGYDILPDMELSDMEDELIAAEDNTVNGGNDDDGDDSDGHDNGAAVPSTRHVMAPPPAPPPADDLSFANASTLNANRATNSNSPTTPSTTTNTVEAQVFAAPDSAAAVAAEPIDTKTTARISVRLACEWMRCTHLADDYAELRNHLNEVHGLAKDAAPPPHSPTTDDAAAAAAAVDVEYDCSWDQCNYSAPTWLALRCHVYQHANHAHLKAVGESLLERKKLTSACRLDSRRRNTLPDATITEYACQWLHCNERFEGLFELGAHVRKHVDFVRSQRRHDGTKEGQLMRCGWSACGKQLEQPWRLVDHVRLHVGERQMGCPNCGSTFASYAKFYAHFHRQAAEKPYQCVHCSKYFYNENLLTTHMHCHVNCYKCTLCDMTCPSPSALAKHVRQRHIDEKPFQCRECPYRALLKKDLERHIMTQHEQHVFACDAFDCDFQTTSYYLMRMHDKRVHCGIGPPTYACHCCAVRYARGVQLSEHLIDEHQFQLPSGHSRFTYRPDLDGLFRLQTMRMESLEVTQAIMSPSRSDRRAADLRAAAAKRSANVTYEVSSVHLRTATEREGQDDGGDDVGAEQMLSVVLSSTCKGEPGVDGASDTGAHGVGSDMPRLRFSEDESTSGDASLDTMSTTARRRVAARKSKATAAQRRLSAQQQRQQHQNQVQAAVATSSATNGKIKNIQDFSVMKRYLRKENTTDAKIVIELTKVDASGNVLRSETMCADEFRVE